MIERANMIADILDRTCDFYGRYPESGLRYLLGDDFLQYKSYSPHVEGINYIVDTFIDELQNQSAIRRYFANYFWRYPL